MRAGKPKQAAYRLLLCEAARPISLISLLFSALPLPTSLLIFQAKLKQQRKTNRAFALVKSKLNVQWSCMHGAQCPPPPNAVTGSKCGPRQHMTFPRVYQQNYLDYAKSQNLFTLNNNIFLLIRYGD